MKHLDSCSGQDCGGTGLCAGVYKVSVIWNIYSVTYTNNPYTIGNLLLGWPKSPFRFFRKIKDTIFFFPILH